MELTRGDAAYGPGINADCVGTALVVHHGSNDWPVTVLTTYPSCTPPVNPNDSGNGSATPTCPPSGAIPPLPHGTYEAVIVWNQHVALPTPKPVTITLY